MRWLLVILLCLTQFATGEPLSSGFMLYAKKHLNFLCAQVAPDQRDACINRGDNVLNESAQGLREGLSLNQIRSLSWSYLLDPDVGGPILEAIVSHSQNHEERQIMETVWREFHLIILPHGITTETGTTKAWGSGDLRALLDGLRELKRAIGNRFGDHNVSNYSHLWNSGGLLARIGNASVDGQLGEMYVTSPQQINIVIDHIRAKKSPSQLAQHLAHESGHANDYLRGYLLRQSPAKWTEQPERLIFQLCGGNRPPNQSLFSCLKKSPTWFNFHPAPNYPARTVSEFYTKMIDEWVRENLNLVPRGRYRQQSPETKMLWEEMEMNLILNIGLKSAEPPR